MLRHCIETIHFILITGVFALVGNAFVLPSDSFAAYQRSNIVQSYGTEYSGLRDNRKSALKLSVGTVETDDIVSKENQSISINLQEYMLTSNQIKSLKNLCF